MQKPIEITFWNILYQKLERGHSKTLAGAAHDACVTDLKTDTGQVSHCSLVRGFSLF